MCPTENVDRGRSQAEGRNLKAICSKQSSGLFFTVTAALPPAGGWPGFEASFQNKALHGRSCIHMGGVKQRLNPSPRNQPFLFPLNYLHVSGSHFPHSHGPFCPCSCPCSRRSLSDIAFVTRRRRCGQMGGRRPEKPEAHSLEYVEDFSWPRTT